MLEVFLSFLTAFALTYFAIPSIINIARLKNLVDEPGERKSHVERTPSLGGIGIFAGVIFSTILWTPDGSFGSLQYILGAFIIVFLIGAKDDIIPLTPFKKLVGQILAAAILVFKADVRLVSLHGIFGVGDLPEVWSYLISIFTILVIINAFNLIDGINGLSGSIAVLIGLTLGAWFWMTGQVVLTIVAFSMAGAVLAFLRYNITPARIFMGDTGALLIGLVSSILAIQFIEFNDNLPDSNPYKFNAVPAIAMSILILPLFDTLRVFITRALKGKSPLSPDRTHIHHLLIDSGLSHMQATGILLVVNIAFIFMAVYLQNMGTVPLLILVFGLAGVLSGWLYFRVTKKKINKPIV
jgi:UDP-GlcNAc:undecaprenyl-phosphate GlcNAc-1-phosphate transferase